MGCGCKKGTAWAGPTVGAPRMISNTNLVPEQYPRGRQMTNKAVNVKSNRQATTTVLGTRNAAPPAAAEEVDPWSKDSQKLIDSTFEEIANRLQK